MCGVLGSAHTEISQHQTEPCRSQHPQIPQLKEVCMYCPRILHLYCDVYRSNSVRRAVREPAAARSPCTSSRSICHSAVTLVHAGSTADLSAGGQICMEGPPTPRQTEEAADIFGICREDPPEGQTGKGVV